MLAGFQGSFGDVKMAGVRRCNTDNIHPVPQKSADRIVTGVAGEVRNPAGSLALVLLRSRTGAAGDRGQGNFDEAKIAAIQSFGVKLLEERTVRLFEDHAQ